MLRDLGRCFVLTSAIDGGEGKTDSGRDMPVGTGGRGDEGDLFWLDGCTVLVCEVERLELWVRDRRRQLVQL